MFNGIKNSLGMGSQAQEATVPAQTQPAAAVASDQIKPNGMNPANPAAAGVADPANPDAGKSETNPLDAFKDLYKVTPPADGEAPVDPHLQITNEVLDKVVTNIDFMAGMSPETKQGLATGDPQAIVAAMKNVAENSYRSAMQHNAALMNDHLDQRFEGFKPTVAASVDKQLTSQAVASLPNASNPVIRAELDRVSTQLRNKFPSADSAWIANQANTYLTELGSQLAGPTPAQQQKAQLPESVDFAALLAAD